MKDLKTEKAGRLRRRALILSVFVCLCVVSVISSAVAGSFVRYAVSYDGEFLGTVSSRADLNTAISAADTAAAEILGEEHLVYDNLAVTTVLSSGGQSPEVLAGELLESVEGIEYRPCLTVDGELAAAVESEDTVDAVLEGILARYTTESTVSVEFINDLAVEETYVSAGLLTDAAGLSRLLDPENADSPWALTVISQEVTQALVTVPFEERVTYDDTLYSDESVVTQEGVDGQRMDTVTTILENGISVTSYVSASRVLSEPVAYEITVGTIPGSRTDSTGSYIWPTTGIITSAFGYRDVDFASSNHQGVDIGNSVGTDVWAADGGTVIYAKFNDGGYGNLIKIQHDNGTVTWYAHLNKILVSVGDKVYQGQIIAEMGKTGRVSGPHLHFEIHPNGASPANPAKYLSGKPDRT